MTETYQYGIDVDALDAVDFHTHVEIDGTATCSAGRLVPNPILMNSVTAQRYLATSSCSV